MHLKPCHYTNYNMVHQHANRCFLYGVFVFGELIFSVSNEKTDFLVTGDYTIQFGRDCIKDYKYYKDPN